ncbi:MAG: hypothetical protein P0Y53_24120 [Candidatus Pseudobacter hemicellulosilyticus]|uniref:Methylamine utilisation protein MauE domain-containing protein n=1 Tax=Candidatus Pseudobacter hemicellulosilyticus TaxID=3121375 RepID=A0AAJ6BFX7_9BACT|nr:MAG: hypothetical protein P0Y53_24120 [Pseudobacter sp.]
MQFKKFVKQQIFTRRFAIELFAVLFMSMFFYTAISKLTDYTMSREQMALMPLMTPIAHIVSWLLPLTEIILATLLFFPLTRKIGFYLSTSLMISFTLYIVYMMLFYPELPCSCGGFLSNLSWPAHLVFNGAFILMGILAIILLRNRVNTNGLKSNNYSLAH